MRGRITRDLLRDVTVAVVLAALVALVAFGAVACAHRMTQEPETPADDPTWIDSPCGYDPVSGNHC